MVWQQATGAALPCKRAVPRPSGKARLPLSRVDVLLPVALSERAARPPLGRKAGRCPEEQCLAGSEELAQPGLLVHRPLIGRGRRPRTATSAARNLRYGKRRRGGVRCPHSRNCDSALRGLRSPLRAPQRRARRPIRPDARHRPHAAHSPPPCRTCSRRARVES
jgi:hypothetical protein